MSRPSRRLSLICLVGALALAAAGQFYFARRREFMWDGIVLYGLGTVLFLAAVSLVSPARPHALGKPAWRQALDWASAHPWRVCAGSLSVLVTLYVGARAMRPLSSGQGYALLGLWVAGILLYLATAVGLGGASEWVRGLRARLWANRGEVAAMAFLFLVASLARLVQLERIPFILGGDEAAMGCEALQVLHGRLTNPFATGWTGHPTLYYYILAASLRLYGGPVAGLRLVPALAGALCVPALYLLARELFDRRVALLSALYLACYHFAVHFSRLALNNAVDPLLALLAFCLLVVGLRGDAPRAGHFALAGVLFGLGAYFYTGGRAIPVVAVVFVLWLAWREPGFWRTYRSRFLILLGAWLVTGWPLFVHFARHPQDFLARANQVGIFQSGWLAYTAEATQRGQLTLLWEQVLRSALAFHYYHDPGLFYRPGMPLLDVLSAVPFTFGVVYSIANWRERRHALFTLWLGAILFLGSVLLENPPSAQRLVLAAVPASLFVALGISLVADVLRRTAGWGPLSAHGCAGLATALLSVLSLWFYFGPYTASRVYPDFNTEVGHQMGLYLRQLGPGHRYYFFGAPRMYADFPNIRYLAPEVEGEDVLEPLMGPPAFVRPDTRPVFLFLPERLNELEQVRALYPMGRRREFWGPSGPLLFVSYEPE